MNSTIHLRSLLVFLSNVRDPLPIFFPTLLSLLGFNPQKHSQHVVLEAPPAACLPSYQPTEYERCFDLKSLHNLAHDTVRGPGTDRQMPLFIKLHPAKSQAIYRNVIRRLNAEPGNNALPALLQWAEGFSCPDKLPAIKDDPLSRKDPRATFFQMGGKEFHPNEVFPNWEERRKAAVDEINFRVNRLSRRFVLDSAE